MTTSLTTADYLQKLDPQMQNFVAETDRHYPPDAVGLTIDQQRAVYDRMSEAMRSPRPALVQATDMPLPGDHPVPLRNYRRADMQPRAAVLYLHGGGFVVGGLDSHDDVCAEICDRTGFRVVAVDYRLSPEHQHPAAFDDAMATARWLCATAGVPVVIAGDSAGGNLGAAVCHAIRGDRARPVGQVLIYPGLGGPLSLPSYTEHANAPMLSLDDILFYQDIRGPAKAGDPTMAPLQDHDFSDLPVTVLVPAECDPLRDDSVAYADAIRAAGGRSVCLIQPGWLHGGLRARHSADTARQAFDLIVSAIDDLGRGNWRW